jgi:hypothetical protein
MDNDILYEHYKGGRYRLIGVATHTETSEALVVYESLSTQELWARPAAMFESTVTVDGVETPRFRRV